MIESTPDINSSIQTEDIRKVILVLSGYLILYLPTYYGLATTIWTKAEYSHGPLILAISLWLTWKKGGVLGKELTGIKPENLVGGTAFGLGLVLYALGRSQDILIFEVGSQALVLAGIALILGGREKFRLIWFPVFFLIFMVPVPGFVLDILTGPLKQLVSVVVDDFLYYLDYPIARDGVVITIGQYQLLIADACSGLNSMFSLAALGLLYMHLYARGGVVQNTILLFLILPIAFISNIGRVITLVLITYYLGDDIGRGFLHDFAGILEFAIAIMCLIFFSKLLSCIKPLNR